jgi:hypothetical protein
MIPVPSFAKNLYAMLAVSVIKVAQFQGLEELMPVAGVPSEVGSHLNARVHRR